MVSGILREDLDSFFWRQVVANSPNAGKAAPEYEQGWNAINELIRADHTWSGFERNVFYANNRDGTFSDASGAVGRDFLEDRRAFALADFDHDGRQEILLKNRDSPQLRLMKNVMAAVTVETEAGRQTRLLQAGSGFLSQHSKDVFFGLGDSQGAVHAAIHWPSGLVQLRDLPPNHRIWLDESTGPVRMEPFHTGAPGLPASIPQEIETLPAMVGTWLLSPVSAPGFALLSALRCRPVLLHFWTKTSPKYQRDAAMLNRSSQVGPPRAFNCLPSMSMHRTR